MKFEDIEIYGVEKSESPQNAFYLKGCNHVQQSPSYAACLSKIKQSKEGTLPTLFSACGAAISSTLCPAIDMRQRELAEGRAMFFVNRVKLNEFIAERTGTQHVQLRESKPVQTPQTVKQAFDENENGYAAAINAAMAKLSSPKVEVPSVSVQAGMSLADIARMRQAQQPL